MDEPWGLAAALMAGIVLGAFFVGGLWWTGRKGVASDRAALWFLGSMLLRTSVVVLGFYFILGDNWQRLVAGLLGFVIARIVATRFIPSTGQPNPFAQGTSDAP